MTAKLPPLYALRAFEAAVRHGAFTSAAVSLNVTPGAVSRHIKTLEEWFGCQLFSRSGPKVEVTDSGRILADQLRAGFQSLENACAVFLNHHRQLRLKAPTTLTMNWVLDVLKIFHEVNPSISVQISSVWMDMDKVNFNIEPYDCSILLGNGQFGSGTESRLLFEEWLIPVCAPSLTQIARNNLPECELIHPSPDRRDWRCWINKTRKYSELNLAHGKVFDTLEQGKMAAISGHGVSMSDLRLSLPAIHSGLLTLPFQEAVHSGNSYYIVWPSNSCRKENIYILCDFLDSHLPPELPETIHRIKSCQ